MIFTQEQINEVVDGIQGTCRSLDEVINDVSEDKIDGLDEVINWQELCDAVDRAHFLCPACGWWCEVGDYASSCEDLGEDICSDCGEKDD